MCSAGVYVWTCVQLVNPESIVEKILRWNTLEEEEVEEERKSINRNDFVDWQRRKHKRVNERWSTTNLCACEHELRAETIDVLRIALHTGSTLIWCQQQIFVSCYLFVFVELMLMLTIIMCNVWLQLRFSPHFHFTHMHTAEVVEKYDIEYCKQKQKQHSNRR